MSEVIPIQHTFEEVKGITDTFIQYVNLGNYTISLGKKRTDNESFLVTYQLDEKKRKKLLLSVKPEELSEIKYENNNSGILVYFYGMRRNLIDINGVKKIVDVYLKFEFNDSSYKENIAVVISLHEAKWKMKKYKFRI